MALLSCKNLTIGYENHVVIKDLSLEIGEGEYLVILGENGCGKTTLMKTLLSLIKPLGGSIEFGDGLKRNQIGYLPQQTTIQKDFPASVWEVVLSGCLSKTGLRPFYNKAEKELARKSLQKMGLEGMEKQSFRELSGGQQQRVLLARALCATEKMILLDEPVSGLDPNAQAEMYALIKRINDEGVAVITISHDVEGVLPFATRVLRLGGRITDQTTAEFLAERGRAEQ